MATPITIPRLGWNADQGTFVGWLKPEGAAVRAGEPLFTLESEKATEDVECFDDGILHILPDGPHSGDALAIGAVIGFVLQPGEPLPVAAIPSASPGPTERPPMVTRTLGEGAPGRDRLASSPRARRAAAWHGLNWRDATGTGRSGRIRERDVLAMAAGSRNASPATRVRSLRRLIAERTWNSHHTTAPVTLMRTMDATYLAQMRKRWKGRAQDDGVVPTYTVAFIKLAATALAKHPVLNARWEGDRIVPSDGIHVGVAVDTEAGLVVPVVRDVSLLSLQELTTRTHDLIHRARRGQLIPAELQGGTFTVTSLGAIGIDAFTPIINYPECAILGVGRVRRCAVVVDEQIVVRDQVTLSLTFDHRATDGVPAARFLQTLSDLVENPMGEL